MIVYAAVLDIVPPPLHIRTLHPPSQLPSPPQQQPPTP
jgi:hypothetical protein